MAALGGAAAALLDTYGLSRVDYIQKNWWVKPIVYGVGGHFLKRKMPDMGAALLGIAGFQLAAHFTKDSRKDWVLVEGAGLTQPSEVYEVKGLTQPAEVYEVRGLEEGGELVEGMDAYGRQNASMPDASGYYDASDAMGL